jgi:hypothetical protein
LGRENIAIRWAMSDSSSSVKAEKNPTFFRNGTQSIDGVDTLFLYFETSGNVNLTPKPAFVKACAAFDEK